MGFVWPEYFPNIEENLLKTTILDDHLIQSKNSAVVLLSLLRLFSRRRPQLNARRFASFQALQERSSEDRNRDCEEALKFDPVTQIEGECAQEFETLAPEHPANESH